MIHTSGIYEKVKIQAKKKTECDKICQTKLTTLLAEVSMKLWNFLLFRID
jgi:hypothetical protein